MTVARGAAVGSLVAAVIAVGVLMFGGAGGHEYRLLFQSAGQLVKGNQVKIGGQPVGSIRDIRLTDDNQAEVKIGVEDDFAPLHEGTTAVIRVSSLSSIASRSISLSPGPNNAPKIPDGGLLSIDKTTTAVDLDQLFNTLDPKTRKALQRVIQGFATQYVGKGPELNKTYKYFGPWLGSTSRLTQELVRDQRVFTRFVIDTSRAVTAIAERRDDLAELVANGNAFSRAIGQENVALARALGLLPSTLRRANTTFVNLRSTLDDLDALTDATKPVAKDLAPFFRRLSALEAEARPTIRDLRLLLSRRGADNDFLELTRRFPSLQRVASPSFAHSIQALRRSQSVIEFIRPYTPDLLGWVTKFGQGASSYDANGHYARILPIFNAFAVTAGSGGDTLTPIDPAQRKDILTDRGNDRRCPGAATQPAKDRSSPFTDDGRLDPSACDPTQRPPGP